MRHDDLIRVGDIAKDVAYDVAADVARTLSSSAGVATYTIGSDPSDDYSTFAAFAAAETPVAGDTISFRKGDVFHEGIALAWSGAAATPIYITTHGTGANPQFWGSYAQSSWTKTGGRTNVYQCAASGNDINAIHTTIASEPYWHVWQYNSTDGPIYLTAASDVADCDATAGSCYYDAANDIMYIHPTASGDPNSDGNTYYIPDIFTIFAMNDGTMREYWDIESLDFMYPGRYAFSSLNPTDTMIGQNYSIHDCGAYQSRHDLFAFVGQGITGTDLVAQNCKANGGFVLQGIGGGEVTDITLTRCVYTDTNGATTGQYCNGPLHLHPNVKGASIIDCESHGACQAPLWATPSGTPQNVAVQGLTVTGQPNRFIRMETVTSSGISVDGYVAASKCLLSPAIDFGTATNPVLKNSFFPGSDAAAATNYGMRLEALTGLACSYNVFKGFGYAALYQNSASGAGNVFYNNVFHGNYYGFYTNNTTTNKPTFANNIFFGQTEAAVRVANGPTGLPASTYNDFYGNLKLYVSVTTAVNLATVQGAGGEANSQEVDPAFINAGGSYALPTDYQIPTGSGCKNAGTDVGLTADFWGNAIVGSPDQGIYEFH